MYNVPALAAIAAALCASAACSHQQPVPAPSTATPTAAAASAAAASPVDRGKYLVSIAGCNDCHTPRKMGPDGPGPDMTRFLSGQPQAKRCRRRRNRMARGSQSTTSNMTARSGPWGGVCGESHSRQGHRAWDLDGTNVRSGSARGEAHGHVPDDLAPYARAEFQESNGRRLTGDLCVSADDPAHQKSGAGSHSAAEITEERTDGGGTMTVVPPDSAKTLATRP